MGAALWIRFLQHGQSVVKLFVLVFLGPSHLIVVAVAAGFLRVVS